MAKKRIKIIVDIAMTVLLPMLMAYSLFGEKFHEFIGTLMFVLFILHHVLNRKWYGSLFKGKYHARRIFQTMLDVLLIVFMPVQNANAPESMVFVAVGIVMLSKLEHPSNADLPIVSVSSGIANPYREVQSLNA